MDAALRDIKRVDEAFAWENDVADVDPEDDALARWSLGKAYDGVRRMRTQT